MPTDGQADPSGITQALARGARNRGVKIYRHTLVTGFEFGRKRVSAVKTNRGDIQCEIVVNCSGMWGYQMGRLLGVNTPVVPFQHQYLVSEVIDDIPPDIPTIRDKDNLIYYKGEVGVLVMGGYERDGIPWAVDSVPNDFSSRLLDSNTDHFMQLAEPAIKRTPCLQTAGVSKLINGPEAFTPDGSAIMGPAPELDNCFVAVGFNAFGIAAGGGAGRKPGVLVGMIDARVDGRDIVEIHGPAVEQAAAGNLIEPPVSLPKLSGTVPAATHAAAPPRALEGPWPGPCECSCCAAPRSCCRGSGVRCRRSPAGPGSPPAVRRVASSSPNRPRAASPRRPRSRPPGTGRRRSRTAPPRTGRPGMASLRSRRPRSRRRSGRPRARSAPGRSTSCAPVCPPRSRNRRATICGSTCAAASHVRAAARP